MPTAKIQLPDGRIAKFEVPEGTPPEQVMEVAQKQFAPKSSTPVLDRLEAATGGFIEGIPVIGPFIKSGAEKAVAAVDAAFSDRTYEQNVETLRQSGERVKQAHPVIDTASQIAGSVTSMIPAVAAAPAAFGAGSGPLLARMLASGTTGAAVGGADAAVRSGGDMEAVKSGAMWGGGLGALSPAVAAGAGKVARGIANKLRPGAKVPTTPQIRTAANAAYKEADQAGLVIGQKAVGDTLDDISTTAAQKGFHPRIHPKVAAALDALDEARSAPQSLGKMDQYRRILKSAAASNEADERRIARELLDVLDDRLSALTPADVVAGDAQKGVSALTKARELWTRFRKAELVDDAVVRAQRRAASTGSGGNVENAIRQNIRAILDKPKTARLFTPEERAAMENVVRGTGGQNLARLIGKLSPQGNGLMAALGIGATAYNPLFAIPAGVGMGAKKIAEGATNRNLALVEALVRSGGQVPQSPIALSAQRNAEALARALMAGAPPVANQQLLRQ